MPVFPTIRSIALALTLPLGLGAQIAPAPVGPAGRVASGIPAETLELVLHPYILDLKTLDVEIHGENHRFLLDTGGGVTAISPELAKRMGLVPWGRPVGYRMTGETAIFRLCSGLDGVLDGQWRVQRAPVGVFDLKVLLPPGLPPLDGVLSLDAFRGQVLTLDLAADRLILHSSKDAERALGRHGLKVRFATGEDGSGLTLLTPIEGKAGMLWFLLDSGDCDGTLLSREVVKEGLLTLEAKNLATLKGPGRTPVRLPVTQGKIHFDGVLGTDYLRQGPVTLDLRKAPSPEAQ